MRDRKSAKKLSNKRLGRNNRKNKLINHNLVKKSPKKRRSQEVALEGSSVVALSLSPVGLNKIIKSRQSK
jgi:hypothetical protein